MEFRFKQSSCVAVGTFNVYIIQPPRLVEMGVLPAGEMEVNADLSLPGIKFKDNDATWTVRPERLAIEAKSWDINCGQYASRLLEKLCWTPIYAVGINAVFNADRSLASELPEEFRLPSPRDGEIKQRSLHVAFNRPSHVINLQISELEDTLELALNIHTQIREVITVQSQQSINEAAREACESFVERREIARELAASLVRGDLVYDHVHAE